MPYAKWEKCLPIVEKMYNEGRLVREIVRICGSFSTVYKALQKLEQEGKIRRRQRSHRPYRRLTDEEKQTIIEMYERGHSIYEIAKQLDRPLATVHLVIKKHKEKQEINKHVKKIE